VLQDPQTDFTFTFCCTQIHLFLFKTFSYERVENEFNIRKSNFKITCQQAHIQSFLSSVQPNARVMVHLALSVYVEVSIKVPSLTSKKILSRDGGDIFRDIIYNKDVNTISRS
jgi:hypothetical protein